MPLPRTDRVPVYVFEGQITDALEKLEIKERQLEERISAGRSDAKRAQARRRELALELKRIQAGAEKFRKRGM